MEYFSINIKISETKEVTQISVACLLFRTQIHAYHAIHGTPVTCIHTHKCTCTHTRTQVSSENLI